MASAAILPDQISAPCSLVNESLSASLAGIFPLPWSLQCSQLEGLAETGHCSELAASTEPHAARPEWRNRPALLQENWMLFG